MASYEEEKIGMVRFDDKGDAIKVSVMLNPDFFCKGLGSEVIRLGTERFMHERKPSKPVLLQRLKKTILRL